MINPNLLDIDALPWMPLEERAMFPKIAVVYFAIDSTDTIQYIGQTKNLCDRWGGHHRQKQLEKLGKVKIAYLTLSHPDLLEDTEKILIEYFNPPLNGWTKRSQKKSKTTSVFVSYKFTKQVKESLKEISTTKLKTENNLIDYYVKLGYLHSKGLNVYGMSDTQILETFNSMTVHLEIS